MSKPKKMETRFWTYGDYITWPEDERWEIINGEAFDMTPSPGPLHQEISVNLSTLIRNFLENKTCKVYAAPFDVLLPDGNEADEDVRTVVQPDIMVVCDLEKIVEHGCRGAPDWVIEIISPSTAGKDHITKRNLYERHGVKEFWVIQPIERTIAVCRLSGKKFGRSSEFDDAACIKVGVLPGLEIDCAKVFPPKPKVVREAPKRYSFTA